MRTPLIIEENVPLAPLTTLEIGGLARFFARITSESHLLEAIRHARRNALPIFILGGGSNLVIPDEGFPGLVLHLALGDSVLFEPTPTGTFAHADSGLSWDTLVLRTCEQGISGIECLAGVPGLTGASPIQNIGAYGQEVASTIHHVTALDLTTLKFVDLSHTDCRFAYRSSIFNSSGLGSQQGRFIITQVTFFFPPATPNLTYADLAPLRDSNPTPLDVYHVVREIRERKGMLLHTPSTPDTRSAGSFFKNPIVPPATLQHLAEALAVDPSTIPHWPVSLRPGEPADLKLPAAWLIEQAGFPKGFSLTPDAPVAISSRHTLALTNRSGHATAADLYALRDHVIATLQTRFGITLEQEPVAPHPIF